MRDAADLLPLSPTAYMVLLALADGPLHGYAMMEMIEAMASGAAGVYPAGLYATLTRMNKEGLIQPVTAPNEEKSGGPQRRYYRLTAFGRAVARAEAARLRQLLDVAARFKLIPEGPG